MKNFNSSEIIPHWKDLIPKIEPEICALYVKDENNWFLAWGADSKFDHSSNDQLNDLQAYFDLNKGEYICGYLSYDLKNEIEKKLTSSNKDELNFPLANFFVPTHMVTCNNGRSFYTGKFVDKEWREWLSNIERTTLKPNNPVHMTCEITEGQYVENVSAIKEKIQRGDIYEMNYCIPFSGEAESFEPFYTFQKLNELSNAPFSSYLNFENGAIISSSPERFFKREKNKVTSQPIKGTAKRSSDSKVDNELKEQLTQDPKERSENIMIVDLVRNDLSKFAQKDSVTVEELCEPYTFPTVHQLISTIFCYSKENISNSDILKALFPMGSMTGAPKVSAMSIAEEIEIFKRGIYSGAIGLIHPNGNCDFNVVIRSILYNRSTKRIIAPVGGAITIKSDPTKEYQECLTKLEALKNALC